MSERRRVLRAPDPRLLLELIPEDVFRKITQKGICFVVDDDGTISDAHPMYIEWLARRLKRPLKPEENTRYDFLDIDSQALGMLKVGVFGNAKMHRHLPVIAGAATVLQEIFKSGIPMVILTARPPQPGMVRATYDHKVDHKIPFDLMIFSRKKKDIVKALKRLGCQVIVVDDDPRVIAEVSQLVDVTAVLFDAPYNRRMHRENVIRAKPNGDQTAWDEVLKVFRKIVRNGPD